MNLVFVCFPESCFQLLPYSPRLATARISAYLIWKGLHRILWRDFFFLPLGSDINKTLEAAAKILVQLSIFAVIYEKYIFELYLYHTL